MTTFPAVDPVTYAAAVQLAARHLAALDAAERAERAELEAGWDRWLTALCPAHVARSFAPYHAEFWR